MPLGAKLQPIIGRCSTPRDCGALELTYDEQKEADGSAAMMIDCSGTRPGLKTRPWLVAALAALLALGAARSWRPEQRPRSDGRPRTRRELSRLVRRRHPAALRCRARGPALVLVRPGVEGIYRDRRGQTRLRHGVLGDRHERLEPDLGAADAGQPEEGKRRHHA